jgi:putative salt-induced outer membrane protein YdiY
MMIPLLFLVHLPATATDTVPSAPAAAALAPLQDEDEEERVELPHWRGSVNVGGTLTAGNNDTEAAAVAVDVERRGEMDRWTLKGAWNYGKSDDRLTQRRASASAKYDYFLTERLYLWAEAGAETDTFANLELRYYGGGGAGYQFIERERLTLSGEVGLTYFVEEYRDVPPGEDDSSEYLAAKVGYDVGWDINDNVRFEQSARAYPSVEDVEDFYSRVDSKFLVRMTNNFSAFLQHVLDYDNTPAPGAKQADHLIVLGVAWAFG